MRKPPNLLPTHIGQTCATIGSMSQIMTLRSLAPGVACITGPWGEEGQRHPYVMFHDDKTNRIVRNMLVVSSP